MTDAAELRSRWRLRWLSSIRELADYEEQHQVWTAYALRNPHYSYIEYVNCYFDDLRLGDEVQGYAWAIDQGYVSIEESAAVATLHRLLDRYDPPGSSYDNEVVLSDSAWLAVTEAAGRAQQALLHLVTVDEERRELSPK